MNKISLAEIIRYFFSGFLVIVAFGIKKHINISDVTFWIKDNQWISGLSPVSVGIGILFIIGYYSFIIYRNIGYDCVVLFVKWLLPKIPKFGKSFYSYRELIQDDLPERKLTIWERERLYRVLRNKIAPEFYGDLFSGISAGLHLLYFTSFVFIFTFAIIGNLWATILSIIIFLIAIGFDWHFERQELLIFLSEQDKLKNELHSFLKHPAWK